MPIPFSSVPVFTVEVVNLILFSPLIEKNGKTLHLLKQGSKRIASDRKRKKVPLMGSFGEYKESKQKPQPPAPQHPPVQLPGQINAGLAPMPPSMLFGQGSRASDQQKDREMKKK